MSTLSKSLNIWLNPIVISAKTMNKRCKISKVCSRKSYSDRNKRDSLAYNIYDRLQEAKRGNITQYYCSTLRYLWTIKRFMVKGESAENFNDYFETKFDVLPTQ